MFRHCFIFWAKARLGHFVLEPWFSSINLALVGIIIEKPFNVFPRPRTKTSFGGKVKNKVIKWQIW